MAYFPKFGPFYDPKNEHEFYGERDGRLWLRHSRDGSGSSGENGMTNNKIKHPRPNNNITNERQDSGWTGFLQDHGNLFYIETTQPWENNSHTRCPSSTRAEQNKSHSVPVRYLPDSNGSSRINPNKGYMKDGAIERQSSADNESVGSSDSSYLNERHHFDRHVLSRFNRDDKQRNSDGSSQSDHSYTTFSEYLDASNGPPITSQKRQINVNHKLTGSNSSSIAANQNQSGKRKSIVMVPDLKNVTDVYSCSGILLCEKLFGIKLCNYKDKPPRPNGSSVEQILRDRKVIVQGVVPDSQADICSQIHRGDMLVEVNDINVTWVNIDELIRSMSNQWKVKLTFQVPLVIGPKQSTPPVTPTQNSSPLPQQQQTDQRRTVPPPLPPHIPLQAPAVPPRQPKHRPRQHLQDLVHLTTGETVMSLDSLLKKHLFCAMYLTLGNQSDSPKADVIYQFPPEDNKLVEIRGLFVTLTAMMKDVTNSYPKLCHHSDSFNDYLQHRFSKEGKQCDSLSPTTLFSSTPLNISFVRAILLTCVRYREQNIHTVYWRYNQDVLVFCLPENRVPDCLLQRVFFDFTQILQLQHKSVSRCMTKYNAFPGILYKNLIQQDKELHGQLDQLVSLILYRELLTGVASQSIPHCSPLEPQLLDLLAGVQWLELAHDDKILCDEILSEFEAQDFQEQDGVDPDVRRRLGIVGSCLFYKDYLLCSHLYEEDLQDVSLFLKYHCILYLVNKEPVEDLVLWREVYPSRIFSRSHSENPAYKEPNGRWFLLIVGMRHFLHCTILECGGYASQIKGQVEMDPFFLEQSRTTLAQLNVDDTDIEQQCNERLFSESHGPRLKSIDHSVLHNEMSPVKLAQNRTDSSPRFGNEDADQLHSLEGAGMRRQGSRISRNSNDSNGSNGSAGLNKNTPQNKKGSMYDVTAVNRSFTESRISSSKKITRGSDNLLLHYVSFNSLSGVYVSPTPCDLSTVQGSTHEHVLYNFYECCLKIRNQFECIRCKQKQREEGKKDSMIEEALMFTCQLVSSSDQRRPPTVLMYWVIGRLFANNQELFVCIEDGAPQTMLELAFKYQHGLT